MPPTPGRRVDTKVSFGVLILVLVIGGGWKWRRLEVAAVGSSGDGVVLTQQCCRGQTRPR